MKQASKGWNFIYIFPKLVSQNCYATEDQFQHSLRDCSQCLKSDELRKVLPKFLIKNIYLKKGKEQWA